MYTKPCTYYLGITCSMPKQRSRGLACEKWRFYGHINYVSFNFFFNFNLLDSLTVNLMSLHHQRGTFACKVIILAELVFFIF